MSEACSDHSSAPMPVKWKKGDVHPVTGMVFVQYLTKDQQRIEKWTTPESFRKSKEKRAEYEKRYKEERKDDIKEWNRKNYEKNRNKRIKAQKEYYEKHRDRYRAQDRERYQAKRDEFLARSKKYKEDNPDKVKNRLKEYRKNNRKKLREDNDKLLRDNPLYAFSCRIRSNTFYALKRKGMPKKCRTRDILGCDQATLIKHFEDHFQPGMTWENMGRGGWHIDHHIPLATATTEEEVLKLCHYTNLRPLWEKDNLSKNKKHPDDFYGTK